LVDWARSKKPETIKVRIPPELQDQLGALSRTRGVPMSRIVRDLVDGEIAGASQCNPQNGAGAMTHRHKTRIRNSAFAGAALFAFAAVWNASTLSPAIGQTEIRITFAELDADKDGLITQDEFAATTGEDSEEIFDLPAICAAEFQAIEGAVSLDEDDDDLDLEERLTFAASDKNRDGHLSRDELLSN